MLTCHREGTQSIEYGVTDLCIVSWVAAVIHLIIIICLLYDSTEISVLLIKVSAKFVNKNLKIFWIPILMLAALLVLTAASVGFAAWISDLFYEEKLVTSGQTSFMELP